MSFEEDIQKSFINELINMFIDEMMKEDVKKKVKTYLVEPSFTF